MNDAKTDLMPTQTGPAQTGTPCFEAFRAQTFPHLESIYSDAVCLMGNQEDAADLTVEAYFRAFLDYACFRRRHVPANRHIQSTRAWLYRNLHAAFCDRILARTSQSKTLTGGRS